MKTRSRVSQVSIFLLLLAATLCIPLMIEAIFPPGARSDALPPEEPLYAAAGAGDTEEAARVRDNVAWIRGDAGSSILDQDADDVEDLAADAVADLADADVPLDLRPGVFAGYWNSWDNLDIRREGIGGGAFFFISSHTRVQAGYQRLRFKDDTDRILGNAYRLDGAHRLPAGWLLEEGVERDTYDDLHKTWNGDVRLSGGLTPKLGLSLEGGTRDMWERLANIRDRLRLYQVSLGLFYELLPRWWLAGFGTGGWLSDHNHRSGGGGEVGYVIAPRWGLSASAGAEATSFAEDKPTYWSPSYYHYIYGRLRLTRNFDRAPFERLPGDPMTAAERWGYLAEVTGGVNDEGHYEQSVRAGLKLRATRALTLRGEFYHLDSDGRFDAIYAENRVDAGVEVRFGSGR